MYVTYAKYGKILYKKLLDILRNKVIIDFIIKISKLKYQIIKKIIK